jgi:hypothetical protein
MWKIKKKVELILIELNLTLTQDQSKQILLDLQNRKLKFKNKKFYKKI